MTKQAESIQKQLLQIKYLLGMILLASIITTILFLKNSAVIAPNPEIDITSNTQALTNWSCPATVWLDCKESTETEDLCSENHVAWLRSNCPGFQGVVK